MHIIPKKYMGILIKLLTENKLIICAFVNYFIKFQEKNLNLNQDSNSDLQPCSGMLFQEEGVRVNWQMNKDSSMVERQARDLEVRVRVPVQVQIFLLKCDNANAQIISLFSLNNLICTLPSYPDDILYFFLSLFIIDRLIGLWVSVYEY